MILLPCTKLAEGAAMCRTSLIEAAQFPLDAFVMCTLCEHADIMTTLFDIGCQITYSLDFFCTAFV